MNANVFFLAYFVLHKLRKRHKVLKNPGFSELRCLQILKAVLNELHACFHQGQFKTNMFAKTVVRETTWKNKPTKKRQSMMKCSVTQSGTRSLSVLEMAQWMDCFVDAHSTTHVVHRGNMLGNNTQRGYGSVTACVHVCMWRIRTEVWWI